MRSYATIDPARWMKDYRTAIRLGSVEFKTLIFCETAPESHPSGLYFITSAAVASMIEEPTDLVDLAFDNLDRAGLLLRDPEWQLVYLPGYCARQFGKWRDTERASRDWKTVSIKRHIASLPPSHLVGLFLESWPIFTPEESPLQAPYQAPTQAPSTKSKADRGIGQGKTAQVATIHNLANRLGGGS
ncbi:hypothetical protein [Thiorhodovibrio frisius]|uniref:Uncharacterized protein n=1 Tax=Thiorhodovibrio frisius TaxID=631362 RepID=H8YXV9_9GAMM|nr:hypothetical protein [Thiorhodovibrio frisius]EIC23285.1 hypothetical protein Thi970DRAFT_00942 [Thiorhodovibrio frisius]WPL23637.1 hypothetical protein Thiofri_03832 [Thiorhodovibrio frisius]